MHTPIAAESSAQASSIDNRREPLEWLALMQCVAPHFNLNRLASLTQGSFQWSLLLQQSQQHCVVSLLGERVRHLDHGLVPAGVRDRLRELRRAQTLVTLRLTSELFRVLECLAKASVEVLVTKGPALSVRCYGNPDMREYGDLDLVIRDADMRRATQAMLGLGYHPRISLAAIDAKKLTGEYAFRKPGTDLLIEFHTERTFRYHPRPLQIEKLFARRAAVMIDGRKVPALSIEDELILICVHGAKHFWERLMWIADVAALISRQSVDWDRAMTVANEVGAERILRLGLRLASDLLGTSLPRQVAATVQSDRTVSKLAAQIESRLPSGEPNMGILQRAAFRVRMPGGLLPGIAYLLRLSLSPTEEDWSPGEEGNQRAFMDVLSRPIRLAKKHSRSSSK
jgi:hypothetical protein